MNIERSTAGTIIILVFDRLSFDLNQDYFACRKNKVPFSTAIGKIELVQVFFLTLAHRANKNEKRQRRRIFV